jgi:hypothetical protein
MGRLVKKDDLKNRLRTTECRIEDGELQTIATDYRTGKQYWTDLLDLLPTGTTGKTVDTDELREYIETHHCEIENGELVSLEDGKWYYLLSCVEEIDLGEKWNLGLENLLRAEGEIAAEENARERRNNGNQNDDQQVLNRDVPRHHNDDGRGR